MKMLLAGAKAVQVVSTLYEHGTGQVQEIVSGIEAWMERHSLNSIDQFRGRLAYRLGEDQSAFERIQFMKHYSGIA